MIMTARARLFVVSRALLSARAELQLRYVEENTTPFFVYFVDIHRICRGWWFDGVASFRIECFCFVQ